MNPSSRYPRRTWILAIAVSISMLLPMEQAASQDLANEFGDATIVDAKVRDQIKGGLKFLASKQRLNGSWAVKEGAQGHPIAMTGYVLLAFMATGNLPDEGEYGKNVAAGMQYLLDRIQPDGTFREASRGQYMYNHGIATIALMELYGETDSASIRPKLQKLVNLILNAQAPDGGWRYTPQPKDSDISVTVLQAVALRAALGVGMSVPEEAIEKAAKYVQSCFVPAAGGFGYQPGGGAGFARTAAAIYSLQVLGKYDDPQVKAGSEYLLKTSKGEGWWSYGNYYAAPAQYMIGGDTWKKWYARMKVELEERVGKSGDQVFWEPRGESKGDELGPIFTTAVAVHILAMPYHYLPLYQR